MAQRHVIQQSTLLPGEAGSRPKLLLIVPVGFSGYVRVKFSSATPGDTMLGSWVKLNAEHLPESDSQLQSTNAALLWKVDDEKTWSQPPGGFALLAIPGSGTGGTAYIDVIGETQT